MEEKATEQKSNEANDEQFELTDENITQEQIKEMKMLGIEKPKKVTWRRWTGNRGVSIIEKVVVIIVKGEV